MIQWEDGIGKIGIKYDTLFFKLCEINLQSVVWRCLTEHFFHVHFYKEDVLFDTDTVDEQNPHLNR